MDFNPQLIPVFVVSTVNTIFMTQNQGEQMLEQIQMLPNLGPKYVLSPLVGPG